MRDEKITADRLLVHRHHWINHHYAWLFVGFPTLGLFWINFVHLFMVSLLPFATA